MFRGRTSRHSALGLTGALLLALGCNGSYLQEERQVGQHPSPYGKLNQPARPGRPQASGLLVERERREHANVRHL